MGNYWEVGIFLAVLISSNEILGQVDQTQAQIDNFKKQAEELDKQVKYDHRTLDRLADQLEDLQWESNYLTGIIGEIKALKKDITSSIEALNNTNKIWASNFRLLDNVLTNLKKKIRY